MAKPFQALRDEMSIRQKEAAAEKFELLRLREESAQWSAERALLVDAMNESHDTLRRVSRVLTELADTFAAEPGIGADAPNVVNLRADADALDRMAEQEPVALTEFQRSAPERVWITVFGTDDEYPDGFPENHENITWSEEISVGDLDIPYVRADLAAPVAPADDARDAREAELKSALERIMCQTDCDCLRDASNLAEDTLSKLYPKEFN